MGFGLKKFFFKLLIFRKRKGEREKQQFAPPLTYVFIGCFLCVPSPGTQPATLVSWDDALTN